MKSDKKNNREVIKTSTVLKSKFPPWPCFAKEEIDSVVSVLNSGKINYWTGTECRQFEAEFASFTGSAKAVALANGTVALEAALAALGIGPGDDVIVTSRTFIASASCIVMRGANPIMADVDPVSQNITAKTIEAALTPKTRAIITVHLAGWPCDMEPILGLAKKHGLSVIEDCAQAHGATYKGQKVGSFGDVAAFSFCQDKIITTGGEGGMVTTSNPQIWEKVWSLKDHGKNYNAVYNRRHPRGFRWLHESFGTNWRMTEMQAAIGRIQLKKIPKWLPIRRRNADIMTESFLKIPALRVTIPPPEIKHAYYKYYVFVRPEALKSGWNRDRIMMEIEAKGISCQSGSCSEIYLEKAFKANASHTARRLPVARKLGETSLMFLVHPTLTENEMEKTSRAVKRVMKEATR